MSSLGTNHHILWRTNNNSVSFFMFILVAVYVYFGKNRLQFFSCNKAIHCVVKKYLAEFNPLFK